MSVINKYTNICDEINFGAVNQMSTVIRNNLIKCKCMNSRWRTDAILEKSVSGHNLAADCPIFAKFCTKMQNLWAMSKISNFKHSRWQTASHFKNHCIAISYISAKYHQILTKFCLKTHIIFVKNWSIYVKPRTKWSAAHSTLSVEYTSPANMFIFRYSSVCLTVTFSFTQYWNVVKVYIFRGSYPGPLRYWIMM